MTPTLYIMCGLPFSGKTTLAKQISEHQKAKMIAYDWIWAREKPSDQVPDPDNHKEWNQILALARKEIEQELKKGNSVVFDHINHKKGDRNKLRNLANKFNAKVVTVYLNVPQSVLEQRREENIRIKVRHNVASVNIKKVNNTWEAPLDELDVIKFYPEENMETFLKRLSIKVGK